MEDRHEIMVHIIEAFKRHRFKKQDAQEYLDWIKLFLNHFKDENPKSLTTESVKTFLRYLCDEKGLMPSRQKQAYLAVNFFYNQVLRRSLWSSVKFDDNETDFVAGLNDTIPPPALPDTESPQWTQSLQEPFRLIAQIMFQCGMKLEEITNLRIEDVELERRQLRIRDAFGEFSEIEISTTLYQPLALQVKKALNAHQQDTRQGSVYFRNPNPLKHNQLTENPRWYFLFPGTLQFNLHTQKRVREPISINFIERAFSQARGDQSARVTPIKRYSTGSTI
ncbi:phage integrase N-terminal SAM-like domain-containing protein [Pleionea sediminis]|uniref:phage integrase N-terminal SAM-like domain-containing protein n=1 Tax=Pleionea sediminis TaxID=2569479 RepID=UPI00118696AB|nr:phage integrase N-terminal SAM-like domain-containing protein [Pleionea sediminis]